MKKKKDELANLRQLALENAKIKKHLAKNRLRYSKVLVDWKTIKASTYRSFLQHIVTVLATVDAASEVNVTLKNMNMVGVSLDLNEIIGYNNQILRVLLYRELLRKAPLKKSTKLNLFKRHIVSLFKESENELPRKPTHQISKDELLQQVATSIRQRPTLRLATSKPRPNPFRSGVNGKAR